MVKIVIPFFTPEAKEIARLHRREILKKIDEVLSIQGEKGFKEGSYSVNMED